MEPTHYSSQVERVVTWCNRKNYYLSETFIKLTPWSADASYLDRNSYEARKTQFKEQSWKMPRLVFWVTRPCTNFCAALIHYAWTTRLSHFWWLVAQAEQTPVVVCARTPEESKWGQGKVKISRRGKVGEEILERKQEPGLHFVNNFFSPSLSVPLWSAPAFPRMTHNMQQITLSDFVTILVYKLWSSEHRPQFQSFLSIFSWLTYKVIKMY